MQSGLYLVSIEAAGKQRYLAEAATFTEVAGASQMIRNLGADAWNMENDDKRITFSMYEPSLDSEMPLSTLTIDDIGKKKQKWHLIMNIGNQYWHYTYSVERTNKP